MELQKNIISGSSDWRALRFSPVCWRRWAACTAKMIRGEREEQGGDACSGGVNMVLEVWHPFGLCEHGCGVVQNSNVVLALIWATRGDLMSLVHCKSEGVCSALIILFFSVCVFTTFLTFTTAQNDYQRWKLKDFKLILSLQNNGEKKTRTQ